MSAVADQLSHAKLLGELANSDRRGVGFLAPRPAHCQSANLSPKGPALRRAGAYLRKGLVLLATVLEQPRLAAGVTIRPGGSVWRPSHSINRQDAWGEAL